MTEDDRSAAAARLDDLFAPFAPLFGKREAREHARAYLAGLTSTLERKSIEPIALAFDRGRVSGLQKFINVAPWRHRAVQGEIQRDFAARVESWGPGPLVVTARVHAFAKKGNSSVGVARQVAPPGGRVENSQLGVFLVASHAGRTCLLDHRLYLPESWCDPSEAGRARRARVRVPEGTHHRTRAQSELDLIQRCLSMRHVKPDWVVSGAGYHGDEGVVGGVERFGLRFLVGIRPDEVVLTGGPPSDETARAPDRSAPPVELMRVAHLRERLSAAAWRGTVDRLDGPYRHGEYAYVPVRSPRYESGTRPLWVVVSRGHDEGGGACRYFLSNAGPETPADTLAAVIASAGSSWCFFEEATSLLGMGRYETRSWAGWHHHMSLVALAHWLVTSGGAAPPPDHAGQSTLSQTPRPPGVGRP
jgi:SRSO17 transposase